MLSLHNAFSQPYQKMLGDSNKWYHFSITPTGGFTDLWKTTGDTLLHGNWYKKVKSFSTYPSPSPQCHKGYIREDTISKKVYYLRCIPYGVLCSDLRCDTMEVLLYDFDLSPGDTVSISQNGQFNYTELIFDTVVVDSGNSFNRKYLLYDFQDFNRLEPICWVEGVGSLSGLQNNTYRWVGHFQFETLLCNYNNDSLIFHFNPYTIYDTLCILNVPVGIEESPTLQASIFPNPASEQIEIAVPADAVSKYDNLLFSLYDVTGRSVYSQNIASEKSIARIAHLPQGIYYWRMASGKESLQNGKIVKH